MRELSGLLDEAGQAINPDGLNRAEKGTRQVTTDELVALSIQLGVNPTALLLPNIASGSVEISGAKSEVQIDVAWSWMDGQRPLVLPDNDDGGEAAADFVEFARGSHGMYDIESKAGRRRIARNLENTPGFKVTWGVDGEVAEIVRPTADGPALLWPLTGDDDGR